MKIIAIIFIFLSVTFTEAQTLYHFSINDKVLLNRQLSEDIGNKQKILDFAIGDISKDGKKDMVLIADNTNGKERSRKIYLFVNQKNNLYSLQAVNENLIECAECGGGGVGDPYQKIIITKNSFSFELLYGDCDKEHRIITFAYERKIKKFLLLKDRNETYNCKSETNSQNEIKIKQTENNKNFYGKLKFENYKLNF